MKKIHKLIVKAFIGPLIVTFFISMLVLLMQFLWKYIDDLMGKGLELHLILQFLWYTSLTLVPLALPITVLLASLMTLGNLGEHYELVAAKSSGISLQKLMRPLFVFVFGIAVVAFVFSNNVFPYAFQRYRTLLHDIQMTKPALNIVEGEYYSLIDGFVIRFDRKERDGQTIHGVKIFDHTEGTGNTRLTMARSGIMRTTSDEQWLQFTLFDGHSYSEDVREWQNRHRRPFTRVQFEEQVIRFDLSSFEMNRSEESLFQNDRRGMRLGQLEKAIDSLRELYAVRVDEIQRLVSQHHFFQTFYDDSLVVEPKRLLNLSQESLLESILELAFGQASSVLLDIQHHVRELQNREAHINNHEIEWHRKFALPFACILLFLIGAPLGAIVRRGGLGMPIVMGVIIFIAYFAISIIGEQSVGTTALPAWRGMWISTFIFLPIGIFLLMKATMDSAFLDEDVWRRKFLKLFGKGD
ncbi:MAG: LptF/LptG family permease [Bacteroidales bacterium]|nr:LptF/LptG family permease [Bacteroidales bacterium]